MEFHLQLGHVWAIDDLPSNSIALDGAVAGPHFDAERRRFSFDHHAGCWRLVTTATCQQVFDALLLGLDPADCGVYLNDLDADSLLAAWLLCHHRRWREPDCRDRVRPLVTSVAAHDAHGTAYPVPFRELGATFASILRPALSRLQPRATDATASPASPPAILADALTAIENWWLAGQPISARVTGPSTVPDLADHGCWLMADYCDLPADGFRRGAGWLYQQGHDRLVLVMRHSATRYRYTICKRSDLVAGFPLPAIFAALNRAEATHRQSPLAPAHHWGGATTVGGSPRDGSILPPATVAAIISAIVQAK